MTQRRQLPPPPPREDRGSILGAALNAAGLPAATETIQDLVVVPTGLHHLDAATGIGGVPVGQITILFGKSQSGKTTLALEICRAFLDAGGVACYVDAEHRLSDADYAAQILGFVDPQGNPLPKSLWPREFSVPADDDSMSFEGAHYALTNLCRQSKQLAEKHDWYPGAVIVVDSLDSMFPETMLKDARSKSGKVEADIYSGRVGQISAGRTREFLNFASKIARGSRVAVVSIHQEVSVPATGYNRPPIPMPRGGTSVDYFSSMTMRLARDKNTGTAFYYPKRNGSGSDEVYGTYHRVEIRKTSVGSITVDGSRFVRSQFWASNGRGPSKCGIDRARDLLETALDYGVLTQAGASIKYGDDTVARSFEKAHSLFATDPDGIALQVTADLNQEVENRRVARIAPVGHTENIALTTEEMES